jgi:Fe-S cluster assembly ATP-binding protein
LKDFLWELKSCAKKLNISEGFLYRYLNENLSGGEKKKMECLQALVLKPKFAIFDEIDTGLDIDALKIVAGVINELAKNGTGVILITHYQRILKYLHSDKIHILVNGRIVKTGNSDLAFALEKTGYSVFAK